MRDVRMIFGRHISNGRELFTAPNAGDDSDAALFAKRGPTTLNQDEQMRACRVVEAAE